MLSNVEIVNKYYHKIKNKSSQTLVKLDLLRILNLINF